jgi:hypothetical protein
MCPTLSCSRMPFSLANNFSVRLFLQFKRFWKKLMLDAMHQHQVLET